MAEATGSKKVILVGHSTGGSVIAEAAEIFEEMRILVITVKGSLCRAITKQTDDSCFHMMPSL